MKNRARIVLAVLILLVFANVVQATYNWYYTDGLTSINGSYWTQNGSLTAGSTGVTTTTAGSLVSGVTAPTYPNDYQVNATINLPGNTSGGYYGILLRATSNGMMSASSTQGSFYLLELQNPTFSNGTCSAVLALQKVVSGVPTTLYSGATWCSSSFTIGATISGSGLMLFANRTFVASINDTSSPITSGQPGINVRSAPAGNTIGVTMLGVADKVAPNSIDRNNIATSSYPNRIDMQWKGAADDANGSGLAITIIYRGSSNLNSFPSNIGEFTDNSTSLGPQPGREIL